MDNLTREERERKTESQPRQTYEACWAAQGRMCLYGWKFRKEEVKKKVWWRGLQSAAPVTAVKEASLTSGRALWIAGAAARQLGAADRWTDSVEERLSSCSQLLCPEASSDSTRLRIDYQSWQFNGVDGVQRGWLLWSMCVHCTAAAAAEHSWHSLYPLLRKKKKKNRGGERREIAIIVILLSFCLPFFCSFSHLLSFLFPSSPREPWRKWLSLHRR